MQTVQCGFSTAVSDPLQDKPYALDLHTLETIEKVDSAFGRCAPSVNSLV